MKKLLFALVVVLATSCAGTHPPKERVTDPIIALQSTVKVYNTMTLRMPGIAEAPERSIAGSGVVLYQEARGFTTHTLIATAKHACEGPRMPAEMKAVGVTVEAKFVVERMDGAKFGATIVYLAPHSDLCFLNVATLVARPAKLANGYPKHGDRVLWTGAPRGLWSGTGHVGVVSEGLYSGISTSDFPEPYMVFSGTAVPGNSGGPIWFKGEVIGILVATATPYGVLVLGVPLAVVLAEQAPALAAWRK